MQKLNIIPRIIRIKPEVNIIIENNKSRYLNILRSFYAQCLNVRICDTYSRIYLLQKQILPIKQKHRYPKEDIEPLFNEQQDKYDDNFGKVKKIHQRKMKSLLEKDSNAIERTPTEWIINLTEIKIPLSVEQILGLGSRFSIAKDRINFNKIIATSESGILTKRMK
ncbi:hypothetical protein HHI36_005310 [Cryptolaemus montrouzieri]|uniref:Uncharacterized protein n=1 Tax=Cryptolaemus montrouzieri TaxID=559131 RepID=A0ABD2NTQ7_9CUCU